AIRADTAIRALQGARWTTADEAAALRASLATTRDPTVAPAPNLTMIELHFVRRAIAHVEALRGARYAYDIRSEILCEKGAVLVGGFAQTMLTVLHAGERHDDLYPGFLERYAEAYALELRDFVSG